MLLNLTSSVIILLFLRYPAPYVSAVAACVLFCAAIPELQNLFYVKFNGSENFTFSVKLINGCKLPFAFGSRTAPVVGICRYSSPQKSNSSHL